jgi:hypothetical protein
MVGVPEGKYALTVYAKGYERYTSTSFVQAEGQIRNLGKLYLKPCGVIHVEVTDPLGAPVSDFSLFCDGAEQAKSLREEIAPGRYGYYQLPLGEVFLEIRADGYESRTRLEKLEAGTPAEWSLTLQSP